MVKNCALAIKDDLILDFGPEKKIREKFNSASSLELANHLIMPGLINAHVRPAPSIFDDLLNNSIDMKTQFAATKERIISDLDLETQDLLIELAATKMIRSGTTTFATISDYPRLFAKKSEAVGIRCQSALPIVKKDRSSDDFHKILELVDEFRHSGLVKIAFGSLGPGTIDEAQIKNIVMLANELQAPIQTMASQMGKESRRRTKDPDQHWLYLLETQGMLGPNLQIVHLSDSTKPLLDIIKKTGSTVIHCPSEKMKHAKGQYELELLWEQGIPLGLGTGGADSNTSFNLFNEAHIAILLERFEYQNSVAKAPKNLIRMITLGGAETLGINHLVGSIERGKKADFIAISLQNAEIDTNKDIFTSLIEGNSGASVDYVFISGKTIMENGALKTIKEDHLKEKRNKWFHRLNSND